MGSPIVCEDLCKRFGRVPAVDHLNLNVPEGSIYALVGPNGAGKTTLIKVLVNLVRPTSGRATLLGCDSRKLSAAIFARLGYVSENQELPEWMTVSYFLGYLKPFYSTWDDTLAGELVRQLDLPRDRKLSALSRGMKMKAALASALAFHPQLILLDEPFGGLDPLVRDEFIEGLLERAGDSTILISSHDLAEVESFASHVGFLDAGRMQLSEEITTLTGRFRQIEITVNGAVSLPQNWPAHWLMPEASAPLIRFIDSRFEEGRTAAEIRQMFPNVANVSISRLALREIFVALAKSRRNKSAKEIAA
ncbi:MAG TPA: ABC transporter ATP-binding protein [Bryobacteraceae bacterium]|nr:ABC transporter ATP-binding protein [Bryobacteraceae bacterium]